MNPCFTFSTNAPKMINVFLCPYTLVAVRCACKIVLWNVGSAFLDQVHAFIDSFVTIPWILRQISRCVNRNYPINIVWRIQWQFWFGGFIVSIKKRLFLKVSTASIIFLRRRIRSSTWPEREANSQWSGRRRRPSTMGSTPSSRTCGPSESSCMRSSPSARRRTQVRPLLFISLLVNYMGSDNWSTIFYGKLKMMRWMNHDYRFMVGLYFYLLFGIVDFVRIWMLSLTKMNKHCKMDNYP